MSQRLLEGEVIDNGDAAEMDRLRGAVDRLTRDRDALRAENVDLRRRLAQTDAPVARLRKQLEPLYRALQGIWGEFDEIEPGAAEAPAQAASPKHSAIWDSWKTRMPGAPAKIIDAMLLHEQVTVEQLVVLTQITRKQTIYDAVHRMTKAGLIDKNGGKFSLKQIG